MKEAGSMLEVEGCTFKPIINPTQNIPKRTLDKFLEDQKKF